MGIRAAKIIKKMQKLLNKVHIIMSQLVKILKKDRMMKMMAIKAVSNCFKLSMKGVGKLQVTKMMKMRIPMMVKMMIVIRTAIA